MNTTATLITLDLNDNKTGNLLAMTDAIDPNLGMCDSIYGLVVSESNFAGIEVEGGYLQPLGAAIHSQMMRKLTLVSKADKKRKMVMDYNSQTGQYEISINDFTVSELSKLTIEVHRIDWNRVPRAVAA